MSNPATLPRQPAGLNINGPLWAIKVAANFTAAPTDATDHHGLYLPDFGIITTALPLIEYESQREAESEVAKLELFGFKGLDLGTVAEQNLFVDRSRIEPAANLDLLPNTPKSGWLWTKDPWNPAGKKASSSDCAFGVLLTSGSVFNDRRSCSGFARPVLRVSPGQCLELLAGAT